MPVVWNCWAQRSQGLPVLSSIINGLARTIETAKEAHKRRAFEAVGDKDEEGNERHGKERTDTWLMSELSLGHGDQVFLMEELEYMLQFSPTIKINGDTLVTCLDSGLWTKTAILWTRGEPRRSGTRQEARLSLDPSFGAGCSCALPNETMRR